jgi:hypothetical protein
MMSEPNGAAFSRAQIRTPKAQGYLIQLCKHFAHKIPATYADNRGRILFDAGAAELDASRADALSITVSSSDVEQVRRLEHVVESHLRRFAFKEDLAIAWSTS